jgi:hypothetical protein
MTELEELILETLSFYEPMTKEKLLLDFDIKKLKSKTAANMEDLELALKGLIKKGYLKTTGKEKEQTWIRVMPKKSFLKRILKVFYGHSL